MIEQLIQCQLFKGLKAGEISSILDSIHHQVRNFEKDELIALSGETVISQHFIIKGSVKGEMVDHTGKTIKIEDIEAPKPLAPAFLFGKNNVYPVNIVANEKVTILSFPKNDFIRLLQMNQIVLKNYLDIISNRAQFLSDKIKFLSFQTIKGKIANYILQLSAKMKSDRLVLPKSQSDLADMFGVTRPSIGRAIREMHQDKIIEASGKKLSILDRQKLIRLMK